LNGEIPPEITVFSELQSLYLYTNMLVGPIPALNELTNLEVFNVEENSLSGAAIVDLSGLSKLRTYKVSENRLAGTINPGVGVAESLQELWLGDNLLNGSLPSSIGNLANLGMLGQQDV
jgi:Leucine-rich repeat (LRR) protein